MNLRYAVRVLLQSKGTALIAVLTLALGIGANTAIFSVVHAVLFSPLPYLQPERLVTVLLNRSGPLGAADFLDVHHQARSFESSGAAELWSGSLTGRDAPEEIIGMHVTEDLFRVLGVPPARGRSFEAGDFAPGNNHVLVISDGLWQRAFAGRPDIVGAKLQLDGAAYTVIGVMPRGFYFAPFWVTQAEIWAPADLSGSLSQRGGGSLRVFARLAPAVGRSVAQAEMDTISARLASAYPGADTGMKLTVESLPEKAVGNVRLLLEVLLGVVGMVLMIACANVANLSLARAAARHREIAVRLALGATRLQIARQFLTESIVLSLSGGAAGLLLAKWCVVVLQAMIRPDADDFRTRLQHWDQLGLNGTVLIFALAASIATGLLFGLAPAFAAVRGEMSDALKQGGRGSTSGPGAYARRVLVAAQIAIALPLLIGAGLLTESFLRLRNIDPGFDAHNVVTMIVSVAGRPEYIEARRDALYRAVMDRVSAIPSVLEVSMTNHLPVAGDQWTYTYWIADQPAPPRGQEFSAVYRSCRPGYFSTMHSRILAGRDFSEGDSAEAPQVVIVNEVLARRHFGGGAALGRRVSFNDPRTGPHWMTIVGVVQNLAQSWAESPSPEIYRPYWQDRLLTKSLQPYAANMTLVARTQTDAGALLEPVKNAVWMVDRNLPLSHGQTLEHAVGNATWRSRFALLLVGIFSGLALVLAMIGVYGIVAYDIARRTQEIGIRMALGARTGAILKLIATQTFAVALSGIVCGLGVAAGLVHLLRTMLYQVDAMNPAAFAGAALLVLLVAAGAAVSPARKAARIDPLAALRGE
jgi:predicted permease